MSSGFKLWLEQQYIVDQLSANNEAQEAYEYLLNNSEIENFINEFDETNKPESLKPNTTTLLVVRGMKIPVKILKVEKGDDKISNEIVVERIDGDDFSVLDPLWPIYPEKGNKKIMQMLERHAKFVKNDNSNYIVMFLALLVPQMNGENIRQKVKALVEIFRPIATKLLANPKLADKIVNTTKIDLKVLKGKDIITTDLSTATKHDADIDEESIIKFYSNGLKWVELEPNDNYILVNAKKMVLLSLYNGNHGWRYTHANGQIYKNVEPLFMPYVVDLLQHSAIHANQDIFPQNIKPADVKKVLDANPNIMIVDDEVYKMAVEGGVDKESLEKLNKNLASKSKFFEKFPVQKVDLEKGFLLTQVPIGSYLYNFLRERTEYKGKCFALGDLLDHIEEHNKFINPFKRIFTNYILGLYENNKPKLKRLLEAMPDQFYGVHELKTIFEANPEIDENIKKQVDDIVENSSTRIFLMSSPALCNFARQAYSFLLKNKIQKVLGYITVNVDVNYFDSSFPFVSPEVYVNKDLTSCSLFLPFHMISSLLEKMNQPADEQVIEDLSIRKLESAYVQALESANKSSIYLPHFYETLDDIPADLTNIAVKKYEHLLQMDIFSAPDQPVEKYTDNN